MGDLFAEEVGEPAALFRPLLYRPWATGERIARVAASGAALGVLAFSNPARIPIGRYRAV